jgi:transposase
MENTTQKIQELQTLCALQAQQIAELTAKVNWYEEQYRLSQKRRFGRLSERSDENQLQLFNEAEAECKPSAPEQIMEEITYRRPKQKGKRDEQLKDLPVERKEYRLPDEEQICPSCGGELHEMSTQTRREIEIIPAKVVVVEHVSYVYSCRRCEREEVSTPVITAPAPKPPLPGSIASPSAIAYIMTGKYVDGLPLYRQEKSLSRLGIELSRQTMANWMIKASECWLEPLYQRLHEILLKRNILHSDETTLQVLREDGREATSKSFMWLYRTGREESAIVLYDYQTTRASKHPERFLEGFKGYLHVDGYNGYNGLPGITLVGCWAHARRKFAEALAALPKEKQNADVAARHGLEFCNRLFALERELKNVSGEIRYLERLKRGRPIISEFKAWLDYQKPRVLPKSAFGQAISYCLNQWDKLLAYLADGRLELDNNRAERSIKPFVIGQKGWLFSNTPRGAKASAIIYSIVETAKENGLNPYHYLTYLFEQMPNIDVKDQKALDELLPWSKSLPDRCRIKKESDEKPAS